MTLSKYVDEKLAITLLLVTVIAFFLNHWLTKKYVNPDGSLSVHLGHPVVGYTEVTPKK